MGAPSSHQRYGDFPYSLILLSGSSLRHTHSPARQDLDNLFADEVEEEEDAEGTEEASEV